jgi:hypothetical protein
MEGKGSWTSPAQKYAGEWRENSYNGQGTLTLPDGSKHVGDFKDGMPHGQGTRTHPDGTRYVGEWQNGNAHGKGTLTDRNGKKQVGEFRNGAYVQAAGQAGGTRSQSSSSAELQEFAKFCPSERYNHAYQTCAPAADFKACMGRFLSSQEVEMCEMFALFRSLESMKSR